MPLMSFPEGSSPQGVDQPVWAAAASGAFREYAYSQGHWTNGVGTMTLTDKNGTEYIGNQYEGHTSWIGCDYNPYNFDFPIPDFVRRRVGNAVYHVLVDLGSLIIPIASYGNNPNVAKNQVNTNAPGGRAAAKSLFRKLSAGKKVISSTSRDGSIRRYTADGSVQIRMKSNGATNVDIQGLNGKEDVHF